MEHTPQRTTPSKELKYTVLNETNDPILHFGRKTGGTTYKITSSGNYIWICNAEGCIFETYGKAFPSNKKPILGQIAKYTGEHA